MALESVLLPTILPGTKPLRLRLDSKDEATLRGIRLRTVPEIRQALDRSIRTINITGATNGVLPPSYLWQLVDNTGEYNEGL